MGAPIKSKANYTGRNFDVGPWNDTHFVRCSRCGWINNLDRNTHSNEGAYEGWGISFPSSTTTYGVTTVQTPNTAAGVSGNTRTYLDGLIGAGCSQCGSLLYTK